ncbi:hypothetical protein PL11201_610047 [Planktothrix sp. PCC 11201]|uniref:hypothetical protein n=1 Tax=Planktothrix sp. PCC 11201 TaxID=1729650 RepID=UPI00091D527E|nr:hypothetical protein [Planktothrix sp. PCC 11201]SKB14201.1 hypothetical protein PL11201_610047 [Planktothrix sp. PCC 11201]
MKFKLPDLTIDINFESKNRFEKIRYIKSILIMILAYWIDSSETIKTYYKQLDDPELNKKRLTNIKNFANPRLINFLLPSRQDGRRLHEINNSLYGALEHGIIYESNNPYAYPRILSIGHAFSHFDSRVDDTEGLGNQNKAHFLLDLLIFNSNKPFDEIEIDIIKTLIKSRIKILLANDYNMESFEDDLVNKLKRLREMFLAIFMIIIISEITGLSEKSNFISHIKIINDALHKRINCSPNNKDLNNYDFSDFMNVFISSIRVGGGYGKVYLLNLRKFIDLLPESSSNLYWIKEIIQLTDEDPFNVEYLESVVLPRFDTILTAKLKRYYSQDE